MRAFALALCAVAAAWPSSPARAAEPPRAQAIPIVFDHDADFDDIAALAYLSQAHKQGIVDLRAVTVTNNGAGLPGMAIRHTRCVLEAAGLGHIPVADNGATAGPNYPSVALRAFVQAVLTEAFPACSASVLSSAIPAEQLLAETVLADRRVRVITVGPLTNLAAALARHPLLKGHLQRAYAMAGAIYVPGELTGEWMLVYDGSQRLNAWVDPPAADAVVRALGTRLWMVPGDAARFVPMTREYAARLKDAARTPEGSIVATIANNPIILTAVDNGLPPAWWDPLTAVSGAHEPVVAYEVVPIRVVLSGPQTGRTEAVATGGTEVNAGLWADRDLFENRFLMTLNGE